MTARPGLQFYWSAGPWPRDRLWPDNDKYEGHGSDAHGSDAHAFCFIYYI